MLMSSRHYEAIVVGAGPAGATVAYELAAAGMHTLLIEKAKLPRYKTCGGGITYKAVRALPFSIMPVTERVLHSVDFSWRTRASYVIGSDAPLVYMVQRSRFDNYLTEQAVRVGTRLLDDTNVISVDADERRPTVRTSRGAFTADYVIGADGATGRVARSVGLMSDRWALAALESEVEVDDATMARWHDRLGLDLGFLPATYGWVFPKGGHLSVGVGGLPLIADYGSRLKQYDAMHTAARVPGGGIRRVIRSHGYLLPCRRPGAAVQKGRVLLVGDAAGLVEAFTGEGIYWAIRSSQIAAKSILDGGPDLDYQQRLDAELMPDLLSARRWLRVYVWLPRACYSLPGRLPFFWQAVCRIIRGERRYTDIRRRLGLFGFVENLLPDPVAASRLAAR
jgi:geranylgeranyl reductase family protein